MIHFRMRARDPDCAALQYRTWTVKGAPDYSASQYTGPRCGESALTEVTVTGTFQDGIQAYEVANRAELKAVLPAARTIDTLIVDRSDGSQWRFHDTSTASDSTNNLVVTPDSGSGRWLRMDPSVTLKIPFSYTTADMATIFTTPTGSRIHPYDAWWEILADMTGGASSSIGVNTSVAGWNVAGDVLGGVAGDVEATLVASNARMVGTTGTKMGTRVDGRLVMIAGDTFAFNRITSAFTAGDGNVRILCAVLQNSGA